MKVTVETTVAAPVDVCTSRGSPNNRLQRTALRAAAEPALGRNLSS